MKAVILVGGFGTRLRPLTLTIPKPLVPFINKPMIVHQMEALVEVGVTEIILAVNYCPDIMINKMKEIESKIGAKITISVEIIPLNTAGPLSLLKDKLNETNEPFFMLNSDIMCTFPFNDLLKFHLEHGAEGTIMATTVDDPTRFGVIIHDKESGRVQKFIEKPKIYVSNIINGGIYIFSPRMVSRISKKPTSIEKDIFPQMAKDGELYVINYNGLWRDIGQPKDYLIGQEMVLNHMKKFTPESLSNHSCSVGEVVIHTTAKIGKSCQIGPNVCIGPNVIIEDGVYITNSTVFENSYIKGNSYIHSSIIGWNSNIGRWARLENGTVLGDDVTINEGIFINGGFILPHKEVSNSLMQPQIIM